MRLPLFLLLMAASLAAFTGCDDPKNDSGNAPDKPVKVDPVQSQIEVSDEEIAAIKENMGHYFDTMSDGRFAEYLDYVYQGDVFDDSLRNETVKMMQEYYDQGFYNVTKSFDIKFASPLTPDSTRLISLIIADIEHEVYVGDVYSANPEQLEPMIRSQYGEGRYKYNEGAKRYEIEGEAKFFAITEEGSLDFKFVNDQYSQSRYLGNLLGYDAVFSLRKWESDLKR
ncbi:MAG: hypothetical protein MK081_04495 [Flavobacteriales bacterium]|nr:hypothetical protein [Flavobacteriales bacterium]